MAQFLQSPGVSIREVDQSLRPVSPVGTTVLIPGFAAQGPQDEPLSIASFSEFEQVYGTPTNAAERYFHHTAKALFNSPATVIAQRLPYGTGNGLTVSNEYSALFYPVAAITNKETSSQKTLSAALMAGVSLSGVSATLDSNNNPVGGYIFGKPTHVQLNEGQYRDLIKGNFSWNDNVKSNAGFTSTSTTWGQAGFVVTNKRRTTINDKYEGFYIGLGDNSNLNPATNFDAIIKIESLNENTTVAPGTGGTSVSGSNFVTVPLARRNFALSSVPTGTSGHQLGSVSEAIEEIPTFDISSDSWVDSLIVGVFKLRASVFSTDTIKLDYVLSENYVGSFDRSREVQNETGGAPNSFYLQNVEDNSPTIEVLINPNISTAKGTWLNANGDPTKFVKIYTTGADTNGLSSIDGSLSVATSSFKAVGQSGAIVVDAMMPLGNYQMLDATNKNVGDVNTKLERVFDNLENIEVFPVDIVVEAGLGTVYYGSQAATNGVFDDEANITIDGSDGSDDGLYKLTTGLATDTAGYTLQQNYRTIFNVFNNFVEKKRKDLVYIADVPRHILVQGNNFKTLDNRSNIFSQHVYWPLRHIYDSFNTSFAVTYCNWARVSDGASGRQIWAPFSGFAAAVYANSDFNTEPWYAPAGPNRGIITGVNDLAVSPAEPGRNQLYKISINPVVDSPTVGMMVHGQKTMFKKPSALDRVNVRRLLLNLQKATRNTLWNFLYEPNTVLTRTQIINILTPIFENAKNTQGLTDFLIVCDERNNTPSVIDNNELVVDIYVKPVRAAEFITANFITTRSGVNFTELVT
tara:strand:+ start:3202 stop:5613 length:2412 start_codon:yes stop_codon:yes gene_type:complete